MFIIQVTKCCAFHAKGLACTKQQVLPSTSPNTAPATKHNTPKFGRKFPKTGETSFTIRGQSEHDPRMKSSVRNPPRNQGYEAAASFLLKNTAFGGRAMIQSCPCHSNRTKYCTCHGKTLTLDDFYYWTILLLRHDKSIT